MIPLLATVWNETLVQNLNDLVGSGFSYAFGNPLYIGIVMLFLLLGTLYALGFTLDVTIVILAAVMIITTTGFNAIGAQYSAFPAWFGVIPLFITAILLVFAIMKIFRK